MTCARSSLLLHQQIRELLGVHLAFTYGSDQAFGLTLVEADRGNDAREVGVRGVDELEELVARQLRQELLADCYRGVALVDPPSENVSARLREGAPTHVQGLMFGVHLDDVLPVCLHLCLPVSGVVEPGLVGLVCEQGRDEDRGDRGDDRERPLIWEHLRDFPGNSHDDERKHDCSDHVQHGIGHGMLLCGSAALRYGFLPS